MKADVGSNMVSINLITQNVIEPKNDLEALTQKLWDFETLGIRPQDEVHEALKDCISFNGVRYQVSLPWKEGVGILPSNYVNSMKRLRGQLKRLKEQPEILHEYHHIINEQLNKGVIEPVVELECSERVHYLPHHAVVRQDGKTTKVRGQKAFLNIEIAWQDRDCLRFLWVQDVDSNVVNPVVYRFCRVVFGLNCSPFLLNATLQHHLDSFVDIDPEFVRIMKESF